MREKLNQPGFCHNDLHAGNIVLGKQNRSEPYKFVLIDFGAAYTDDIDGNSLFSARISGGKVPIAYKNLKECEHNLWADFAGLVKYCMNTNNGLGTYFDTVKTQYPHISHCLDWFDNFVRLFKEQFGRDVQIHEQTGIIYGSDFMRFFKFGDIEKMNANQRVGGERPPISARAKPQPKYRRVLRVVVLKCVGHIF